MADVFCAADSRLAREVAVKVFRPGADEKDRQRFHHEAALLAGLDHPGLVPVFDAGTTGNGTPYLVMPLLCGGSLRDEINRGPLDPRWVANVGADLADALAHVHARDVIHRDIKPSNILFDSQGRSRLADFGISRLIDATRITASGMLVGTAAYLAPEQVRGQPVGPASDIYSLGLVLLECVTGETEYTGPTVEVALARLNRPPRIPATLPTWLAEALSAMTAIDPAARPDAATCVRLLRPGHSGAVASTATSTLTAVHELPEIRSPRRQKGRRRWSTLLGAAGASLTSLALLASDVATGTTTMAELSPDTNTSAVAPAPEFAPAGSSPDQGAAPGNPVGSPGDTTRTPANGNAAPAEGSEQPTTQEKPDPNPGSATGDTTGNANIGRPAAPPTNGDANEERRESNEERESDKAEKPGNRGRGKDKEHGKGKGEHGRGQPSGGEAGKGRGNG
ncbi:serine/threonine protein kinase [Longimycelium tulufanense]|uniref:non-specific serine/threonine protein kinase n=2 Tax=Longimycelium tulufanense TaxID=907463 RepID=A0A8J3FVL0_9PSEU|nr:serine/threonine protein kinase [Longimycelium tulufanense]